jgi:class 3 adenylate cyclase
MEPQIQYARTSDGVSIAYTTRGDGPSLLYCNSHSASMQSLMSEADPGIGTPAFQYDHELAGRTRYTTFDDAGIGASQRDVSDFSLDAQVRAIEAVAAHLAGDPFTLVGWSSGSASAALYAARHPGRVRELACAFPGPTLACSFAAMMREDWSLARRRFAGVVYPEGPVSSQRWYSNAMRESMAAEVAAAYLEEYARADLREIYRQIPVPTLLCVPEAGPSREASLALASLVPDCRVAVVSLEGAGVAAAVLEFMGIDTARVDGSPVLSGDSRGTAIVLFTDVADSTALTERMGDAAFRTASRSLDASIRAAIRDAGGTPVDGKVLGDGVMGVFASAADAINAARVCVGLAGELPMHIGLHAGDVIHEDNNVYGGAVNIASRICGLCAPGEILVSQTVRDLARTSAGVTFEDRGEHALKGIEDPVRVFAVRAVD